MHVEHLLELELCGELLRPVADDLQTDDVRICVVAVRVFTRAACAYSRCVARLVLRSLVREIWQSSVCMDSLYILQALRSPGEPCGVGVDWLVGCSVGSLIGRLLGCLVLGGGLFGWLACWLLCVMVGYCRCCRAGGDGWCWCWCCWRC